MRKIPFLNIEYSNTELRKDLMSDFNRVLESNWFTLGNELIEFEKAIAKYTHTSYSVGVGNGLDALIISLRALGVSSGDEILVPSNTFIATVLAVLEVGAKPILIEPRIETANINPDLIEELINSKTVGIIAVNLYGRASELDVISKIAKNHGLWLMDDNAQALGVKIGETPISNFTDISATSFYPGKNLGALGDAGAIYTNNIELYDKIKSIRNYGSLKKYEHDILGLNSRMDELQAAFLKTKLIRLDDWNNERKKIAKIYNEALSGINKIKLFDNSGIYEHVYHLYVIRVQNRDEIQKYLNNQGIQTVIHYPKSIKQHKAFENFKFNKSKTPIADNLSREVLSLPIYPGLSVQDIYYVCDNLMNAVRR
ncbi:DegT/DnrJ/EryC1/StrS family aminotransferase [Flavobacteriaceae bacterium]|nr:DegT/DnrJ/EryC1/StrS family aminotransferase [Flavobacteriaceae bacterium]